MEPVVSGDVIQEDRKVSLKAAGVESVARTVELDHSALQRGQGGSVRGQGGRPQGLQGDGGCLGH